MTNIYEINDGDLLDETYLTIEDLAKICNVDVTWVTQRVNSETLTFIEEGGSFNFSSRDLIRAKRLLSIEQQFDANEELAALVADLMERVSELKKDIELSRYPNNNL